MRNGLNNSNQDFNYEVLQRLAAMETNIDMMMKERPKVQEELTKLELKELEAQKDIKQINSQMNQLRTLIIKFACGLAGIVASVALATVQYLLK